MGGKNHQPCGGYIRQSTIASRFHSLVGIAIESVNINLEDAIIADMNREHDQSNAYIDNTIKNLEATLEQLDGLRDAIIDLMDEMDVNGYQDLPPIHSLDWDAIGRDFADRKMVAGDAWNHVGFILGSGGFKALFTAYAQDVANIKQSVTELLRLFENRPNENITIILEENRDGNMRPMFAQVYQSWNAFSQRFLASSLISSEIWYAFNGYGSMTQSGVISVAV